MLLQGGSLWDRVVDENDPAHGFTKAEIEERIALLKKEEKESGHLMRINTVTERITTRKLRSSRLCWRRRRKPHRSGKSIPSSGSDTNAVEMGPDGNMLMGYVTMAGQTIDQLPG